MFRDEMEDRPEFQSKIPRSKHPYIKLPKLKKRKIEMSDKYKAIVGRRRTWLNLYLNTPYIFNKFCSVNQESLFQQAIFRNITLVDGNKAKLTSPSLALLRCKSKFSSLALLWC